MCPSTPVLRVCMGACTVPHAHTHTRTRARARAHARTHARTHTDSCNCEGLVGIDSCNGGILMNSATAQASLQVCTEACMHVSMCLGVCERAQTRGCANAPTGPATASLGAFRKQTEPGRFLAQKRSCLHLYRHLGQPSQRHQPGQRPCGVLVGVHSKQPCGVLVGVHSKQPCGILIGVRSK